MAVVLPDIKNDPSKIQLERIAHVYFEHPDLEKFDEFAKDFGFILAYQDTDVNVYRGYGKDPYCYVARKSSTGAQAFSGGAFVAQTEADFDKAAALDGAVVSELSPFPGGGRQVALKSPSGFLFHVVHGQEERSPNESASTALAESRGPFNGSLVKKRFGESCSRLLASQRLVANSITYRPVPEISPWPCHGPQTGPLRLHRRRLVQGSHVVYR